MLEIGRVYRNDDIVHFFRCGNSGGMRRSIATNTLVIISDITKGIYHDKWIDGVLHYTGMEKSGDQDINYRQNRTLAESRTNGVKVYLFEVIEARNYIFRGRVNLVDDPYQDQKPGEDGIMRRVWVFPVQPVLNVDFMDNAPELLPINDNISMNLLWEKIREELGIRYIAKYLTDKNSNPEYLRIILKKRKKRKTQWYKDFLTFVTRANRASYDHFSVMIVHIRNYVKTCQYADDDLLPSDNGVRLLLEAIVGHFFGKNQKIVSKAQELLQDLNNGAKILKVLGGEYIDHLLDSSMEFEPYGTIILYLDNIRDWSNREQYDYYQAVFSVLAHEYFHFHHYYSMWECGSFNNRNNPQAREILDSYNPGSIVKESLASWFERYYCRMNLHNQTMADALTNSWRTRADHFWKLWPYAGACLINDERHFAMIFGESLNSMDTAGNVLGL